MEQIAKRLVELVSYQRNRLAYCKRTEMAVEIDRQIEDEGHFPQADDAFDNGVLTRDMTKLIEDRDKHWVSEIESSRHINWQGQWRRVDEVAAELRTTHPESFRHLKVKVRNGNEPEYWAFTKVVRLKIQLKKGYGRKRLVIVPEQAELRDTPRFLLTDARHWESVRKIQPWNYRWPVEVCHEFSQQVAGFESARGAQGGSGHSPFPVELRSAVSCAAGGFEWRKIGEIAVRRREGDGRPESLHHRPPGPRRSAAVRPRIVCSRTLLRSSLARSDANLSLGCVDKVR
jgi:hypothetical protein